MLPTDNDVVGRVGNPVETNAGDQLRHAVGSGNEVAVSVRAKQRHAADIAVGQQDSELLRGLRLDLAPCRHAAVGALNQLAGCYRIALRVEHILAQEHLMGGMRGVGLVLVDIGGRGVDRPDVVSGAEHPILARSNSGAGQHHEVGLAALDIERIIGLQRNEHRAAAALVHQVKAVVEELAKQREPGIERRRQTLIRRHRRQVNVVAIHCDAERLEGRIAHATRSHQDQLRSASWAATAASRAAITVRVERGRR